MTRTVKKQPHEQSPMPSEKTSSQAIRPFGAICFLIFCISAFGNKRVRN